MNDLINSSRLTLDSREVAGMMNLKHWQLLRKLEGSTDRKGYIEILTDNHLVVSNYFIKSSYIDESGKRNACYKITKMGCEFLANKFTGEKGVLFTAKYVEKFNKMENQLQPQSIEDLIIMQAQSMKDVRQKLEQQQEQLTVTNHRLDNLDTVNLEGDLRQRLVKMVNRYSWQNGLDYKTGWHHFKQNFNTAYHTNIELLKTNHHKETGEELSTPKILEARGLLEDALRVADKMLNRLH